MVERTQLYAIAYYKRNTFMGSWGKMNFRIYKKEEEEQQQLECVVFPGPLNYAHTPEKVKLYRQFEFSDEGLDQIYEYLKEEQKKYQEQAI